MYELKKRQIEQAYNRQQKEIEKMETFIAKNKARIATTTMARSRQKQLDKMERIELVREKPKATFKFKEARTPGRVIIEAKDIVLGYDSPLTTKLNFWVERNKKIAIKGVNGIGKSTLLKTMFGIIDPLEGEIISDPFLEIGYFAQEEKPSNKTALDEIWDLYPTMNNAEVRAALANCGLTTNHIESQMKVLSGGENARVRLCKLMLSPCNVLVLDEPTNHLDVDAKDSLKKAIQEFKGTVVLVSHEPEFYQDVVDEVWNAESWSTKLI
jgi:ATPase subunit of ABC transporter with duplicated ATPase domains